MTVSTLQEPIVWNRFTGLWKHIVKARRRPVAPDNSPEDARERQVFISEMLSHNSDAFQSEMDVQCMMCTYPGRF